MPTMPHRGSKFRGVLLLRLCPHEMQTITTRSQRGAAANGTEVEREEGEAATMSDGVR